VILVNPHKLIENSFLCESEDVSPFASAFGDKLMNLNLAPINFNDTSVILGLKEMSNTLKSGSDFDMNANDKSETPVPDMQRD